MDIKIIKIYIGYDEILNQLLANLQSMRITNEGKAKEIIDIQGNGLQKLRHDNLKNFEDYLKEHTA